MAGNSLLVVALVGLALVCAGLFFVAFIVLLRFAGEHSIGFVMELLHADKEDARHSPSVIHSPKPDLRAIAEAEDFDSALAREVLARQSVQNETADDERKL